MSDNKQIAKNTLFLYIRMIIVMGIGLYVVREVLSLLGVVDYGIYNVVGGAVSMFSFVSGTLSTSSQRYFSIELAKEDFKKLKDWFCLNLTAFVFLLIIFLVIAETIGLWFVNTQMIIPEDRLFAANVVYQLSIFSFCIEFISIPYNALIIAHERMSAFAYISIVEAVLKLLIVFALKIIIFDKLIVYGALLFLTSAGITLSYIIYCHRHFVESRYHYYWNSSEIKELLGFSGWHFLGTFAVVIRSQGINILINMFFNPAINAARAVAYQVYSAVTQLSNNFFIAVKPEMYKCYALGQKEDLNTLINRSTIICTFLVSILVFPILANTKFVLGLWLTEIPNYAIVFTQLVLINSLIEASNGCTIAPALATGKIKKFQIWTSLFIMLNLPISYVALKLGAEPTVTMVISIVLSFITAIVKAYLLREMISFPFGRYIIVITKLSIASVLIWLSIYLTVYNIASSFGALLFLSLLIIIYISIIYCAFVLSRSDLKTVMGFIKRKIQRI